MKPRDIKQINTELDSNACDVLFSGGTERPWSSDLLDEKRAGTFNCVNCGQPLFASTAKFDSGTGWPSFDQALPGSTRHVVDRSFGMSRIEVTCSQCQAHLGHVFDDGPTSTGLRNCINGVCLQFKEK